MSNTVSPETLLVNAMLPEPKEISLVDVPEEKKIPVLKVKLARSSVPAVSVSAFAVPSVSAPARVTVMPEPLIVVLLNCFPTLVMVAEAKNVG